MHPPISLCHKLLRVADTVATTGTEGYAKLALDCEFSWVKLAHDAYENTGKCGELKLRFPPSNGGYIYNCNQVILIKPL